MRAETLALVLAWLPVGCIASNVVATEDRAVALEDAAAIEWASAPVTRLEGMYDSLRIEGDAAGQLWRIIYVFEPDGRYTAAALAQGPQGPAFQTLDGTFVIRDGGLRLDDDAPVDIRASADGAFLRIAAATGSVVLRRTELR